MGSPKLQEGPGAASLLSFPRSGTTRTEQHRTGNAAARTGGRLVLVSHRVPSSPRLDDQVGLPAILRNAVSESTRVLWFGWSGRFAEDARTRTRVTLSSNRHVTLASIDLTAAQCEGYLEGFANGTIWPLFHGLADRSRFSAEELSAYRAVNWHFATRLAPLLHADDRIWVQDYQLLPLGAMLRRNGVRTPLGLFLHTPFPPADSLMATAWAGTLATDLAAYDLIGFQTARDERHFAEFMLRARMSASGTPTRSSQLPATGVFPVGIDTRAYMKSMDSPEAIDCRATFGQSLVHRPLIISAEQLDHSKGLIERLRAFDDLLDSAPEHQGKACLVQITTPSRVAAASHLELRAEQLALMQKINGRFMSPSWKPVHDIYAPMHPTALAALYRLGKVGLATPLSDGVCLGAKEYVAAQDPQDPGVLILSRAAGAAVLLTEALVIDPGDPVQFADALRTALTMPQTERQERWHAMIVKLLHHDWTSWSHSFLYALSHAHRTIERQPVRVAEPGDRRQAPVAEGDETAGVALS